MYRERERGTSEAANAAAQLAEVSSPTRPPSQGYGGGSRDAIAQLAGVSSMRGGMRIARA